jgi:alpha-glucosidase (family GH31 glycosyl hydrolase)
MTTSIEHRPNGSGHPYRIDPDQRHPVHPIAGEPLEIRVLARPEVGALSLEIEAADRRLAISMSRVSTDDLYGTSNTGEGHLAAASGARPETGDKAIFRTLIDSTPIGTFRYRMALPDGETSDWFETSGAAWSSTGGTLIQNEPHSGSARARDVEWLMSADGPVRCRFRLPLAPTDHVIGFGERFHSLDQRGHILDARVFEQYKQQGKRTYLPSPFAIVVGDNGWGFHVRTSRPTWFDVGASDPNELVIEVDVAPADPQVELQIYHGRPRDVITAHLNDIGGITRPPDWVFRPWMSANEWNTQKRVLREVERSRELDIPVGAIVIEAWSDEATFTAFRDATYDVDPDGAPMHLDDFTFPADGAWPNPAGMVARLHELGVKVLLWQIPIVPTEPDRDIDQNAAAQVLADATTMIDRDYCVRDADGSPYRNRGWWFPGGLLPDWTNLDAATWWTEKRRYLLDELGIDGFKTDGGEHAWGDELRYADGSRGVESNNLFANQYATAYHELIQSSAVDGVTFSRAGFTGAGAIPCHWAGDEDSTWEAFRSSITAGLSAGASGIPFWGWDLAGFSGDIPSVELYLRATAMAALCPIMQYHAEYNHGRLPSNDRTPWNIAERHDDERAITVYRQYAKLRERLLPYITAQADRTATTGVPMMRPLCFDHTDHQIWSHPLQYRFGDGLLVAPVCWEGTDRLDIYLPEGKWIDVWTGTEVAGGQLITWDAPLHYIPAFATGSQASHLVEVFAGFDAGPWETGIAVGVVSSPNQARPRR